MPRLARKKSEMLGISKEKTDKHEDKSVTHGS